MSCVSRPASRPLRALALALVAALTVAACSTPGEAGPGAGDDDRADATAPPAPPSARRTPAQRLGLRAGWGPTTAELEAAAAHAGALTTRELAGQVVVASWHGTGAPTRMVTDLHLGGVIAFSENVASARQIRDVNRRLQKAAGREWPLLVGVDQEGGVVERVRQVTRFPGFMAAGAADRDDVVRTAHRAAGRELRQLGFTANFAPVADVTLGPRDPAIGSRSASSRPERVARASTAAAQGLGEAGVIGVVKHFPGHGSVTSDSHHGLPVQKRSLRELRRTDLVPFRAAVEAGLPAVMVGHLDVRAVDPGVPSSLSRKVVGGLLREELGFEGLVVSDSLQMAAVTRGRTPGQVAVRAMQAGNDVLLMPESPRAARDALVAAVRDGRLTRARLEQAAARQIALSLHQRSRGVTGKAPGSSARAATEYASAAVTLVRGTCRGRLVGRRVVPYGSQRDVAAFTAAARAAGLQVVGPRAPAKQRRGASTVALVGYGGSPARADVVVATDLPYVLGASRAPVRIATYGSTPASMHALVQVLLGRQRATGHLPVPVRGVQRQGCEGTA